MLDGGDHQVLHILALDPLCRGDIAQRLAVDAAPPETRMLLVRGKGDNQRLVPLHNQAIEAYAQWQKLAPWLFHSVRNGTKALTRQITRSNRSALNTLPEISRERAA
jgi:site-specific recombinase XerD